jgi:hypothetical protein
VLQRVDVRPRGSWRDAEPQPDFFIGQTLSQKREDLSLTARQLEQLVHSLPQPMLTYVELYAPPLRTAAVPKNDMSAADTCVRTSLVNLRHDSQRRVSSCHLARVASHTYPRIRLPY